MVKQGFRNEKRPHPLKSQEILQSLKHRTNTNVLLGSIVRVRVFPRYSQGTRRVDEIARQITDDKKRERDSSQLLSRRSVGLKLRVDLVN